MHTVDGLFFPVPIVNLTKDSGVAAGSRVALLGAGFLEDGDVVGVVEARS